MANKKEYIEIMSNGLTVMEQEDPERIKKEKRKKTLNTLAKIGIGALALVGAGTIASAAYTALTYVPDEESDQQEDDQDVIDAE